MYARLLTDSQHLDLVPVSELTLYDPVTKIGGMVHYMLPDSTKVSNNSNKAKFADTGIEELLKKSHCCRGK
mgnify:CR=1 FL=1